MWDETKRQRYNQLRDREGEGTLTAEEKTELAAMMQEICDMEATYLQPAQSGSSRTPYTGVPS